MITIHKYEIPVTDVPHVTMPKDAVIFCVQVQKQRADGKHRGQEIPCVWALVDTTKRMIQRRFQVLGTGHPADHINNMMDIGECVYVGTFQLDKGSLVYHLFDEGEIPL